MIICNGTIEAKRKSGGGIDPTTGYPVACEVSYDEPIACQYLIAKLDRQALQGGVPATEASYEVLIEMQPFDADQVRLTDIHTGEVGEYSVISVEPLEAVWQLRIII